MGLGLMGGLQQLASLVLHLVPAPVGLAAGVLADLPCIVLGLHSELAAERVLLVEALPNEVV
jgi:hypothetical protein